jgi:hypothetical protein
MYVDQRTIMKKAELVGVLEQLCQALELSDAQYQLAKRRYEGVGEWLADADSSLLRAISIYLQGSTAIGTTVKPIGCNEHDVDLVAHVSNLGLRASAALFWKTRRRLHPISQSCYTESAGGHFRVAVAKRGAYSNTGAIARAFAVTTIFVSVAFGRTL